jgi:hypothetical protein
MEKNDCIWVAIRIVGLFLIVNALFSIPNVIHSLYLISYLGTDFERMGLGSVFSVKLTIGELASAVIKLLLYGGVGWYLARRGKWVFQLIQVPEKQVARMKRSAMREK